MYVAAAACLGAAGGNLCLQAVAVGLGSVMVGAFNDEQVTEALSLPADHSPALVIPVMRLSQKVKHRCATKLNRACLIS